MINDAFIMSNDYFVALVLLAGFGYGFILYNKFKVQIGGVIATPLLVLYILDEPLSAVVFLVSTIAVYAFLEILVETTLIYGRRLYYLGAIVSIISTYLLKNYLEIPQPAFFSIIPAIIGYNLYRESESVENLSRSIGLGS